MLRIIVWVSVVGVGWLGWVSCNVVCLVDCLCMFACLLICMFAFACVLCVIIWHNLVVCLPACLPIACVSVCFSVVLSCIVSVLCVNSALLCYGLVWFVLGAQLCLCCLRVWSFVCVRVRLWRCLCVSLVC